MDLSFLSGLLEQNLPASGATTLDLLTKLYEVAPRTHHQLIDDWMKKIVFYDLKMESASYRSLDDGRYQVTMRVSTAKSEANGAGEETPVGFDEALEIGILTAHPNEAMSAGQVLYLEKHLFNKDVTELSIVVDQKPELVGVDPYIHRIDKNVFDNLKKVEEVKQTHVRMASKCRSRVNFRFLDFSGTHIF